MTKEKDIVSLIPINKVVRQAANDMYADFETVQARYNAWAVRGIKKLTTETLRGSGKRYAVLNINKNLQSAVLPCDFKEELFVGIINDCGEKIALNINPNIVNHSALEETPCDTPCDAKCNCYPKQLCADLQTTQVINKIRINDTDYDQTITTTLLPNGEYYKVTTTPYLDLVTSGIIYKDTKEYITTFDTATCGCIKPTTENNCLIAAVCWDAFCCYCTSCRQTNEDFGGYRIFEETGTIHFNGSFIYDKCYIEYRGSLPKSGNEYLVPEVAFETLIEYVKHKSIQNKKGVPKWERDDQFGHYTRERGNMNKVLGRVSLDDVLHSALLVPKFDYNSNGCYTPSAISTRSSSPQQVIVTNTQYVDRPSPSVNPLRPAVITVEGIEMTDGVTYSNPILAGVPLLIFADPFNRHLTSSEYTVLPGGGFTVNTGVYGVGDFFHITPKWWLVP